MAENEVLIFLDHMIFSLLCSHFSQLSFYDRKKQLVFLLMPPYLTLIKSRKKTD